MQSFAPSKIAFYFLSNKRKIRFSTVSPAQFQDTSSSTGHNYQNRLSLAQKELHKNPSPEPTPYTLDILDVWTPTDEPNTFFERALCVET